MATNPDGRQHILLAPLESGDPLRSGGWKLKDPRFEAAQGLHAQVGRNALRFQGEAEIAGGKGDFMVCESPPDGIEALGLWIHLPAGANVEQVGLQVQDAESEVLMHLIPADWSGWRWIDCTTTGDSMRPAFPQADKNARVDQPLSSVNVVWFAQAPGATRIAVDGLVARLSPESQDTQDGLTFSLSAPGRVPAGKPVPVSVLAVNYSDHPVEVEIYGSLQRDSSLYSTPLPDPIDGSNHAPGLNSWSMADGETIETGSLTDGLTWTDAGTDYRSDHFTEAFQFVELDRTRRITRMAWLSGDANHTWFVDVAVSDDGDRFTPVAGLQQVNHHKQWGWMDYPLQSPVEANVVRFRYHTGDSDTRVPNLRFPCELAIYDGVADEAPALPKVGEVLEKIRVQARVPARSFRLIDLPFGSTLDAGAGLVGVEATGPGDHRTLATRHVFSDPPSDASLVSADSRFGLNAAHQPLAPKLRDLGVGWVRFENMKWPFVSPAPHQYDFTGSVEPWKVNTDDIFETYRDNGLHVLTYMFLTPQWASIAPADTQLDRAITFPPRDPAWFGEFCFQTAARYGNTRHPADVLLSADRQSGLGLVHFYEMWNEPGLNPSPTATWGGWSAPLDEYYAMMRHGAEAIKRADPTATVTSAGYAGIQVDTVNRLRTYTYPDGNHPLDFVDVLNVHYYSGRNPPETATEDGNTRVQGSTTFIQDLQALTAWRDQFAPGMPIWMTETGYDSAGPFGTTETVQAARLPRVVMLCLAYGIDKVFVYRESGSTPSMHACSGLLRDDFTEKPCWFTFGTLVRQFAGVKGGAERLPHPNEHVWLMKWDAGGEPLLTAWTVNGTARLGIDLGACEVTDAFGGPLTSGNTTDVELTPFPIYLRGVEDSAGWRDLLTAHEANRREQDQRRERARTRRKYLYDFGAPDRLGAHLLEGIQVPYLPVQATDVWNEISGYGFNQPALQNEHRSWVSSKLDGDGCRMSQDIQFQFRVEPGAYRLDVGFSPFEEKGNLRIEGLDQPLVLPATKREAQVATDLVIPQTTVLAVSHRGYSDIRWLSLVEME